MRVRAGSVYIYKPVGMDLYNPANLGIAEGPEGASGEPVRVPESQHDGSLSRQRRKHGRIPWASTLQLTH
jgi:hypothetical protein